MPVVAWNNPVPNPISYTRLPLQTDRISIEPGGSAVLSSGARESKSSFGDDIIFNFNLDEHAEGYEEDELDRAFPGGVAFIRDLYTSDAVANGDGALLVASSSQAEVDAGDNGMGGAVWVEDNSVVSRAPLPSSEPRVAVDESAGVTSVPAKAPSGKPGGPDVIDAGWLYSR